MASDKSLPYDTQSKLNRYNIRANVDLDLTKTTLVRFNVGGYLQNLHKSRSGTDEVFSAALKRLLLYTPLFIQMGLFLLPVATVLILGLSVHRTVTTVADEAN